LGFCLFSFWNGFVFRRLRPRSFGCCWIMSIYVSLGIFLLLAVRDPARNRSLIAFAGWANLAHAGVMAVQEYRNVIERRELAGVVVFAIVGVVLVALLRQRSQWSEPLL
jgi:hypothetical protein